MHNQRIMKSNTSYSWHASVNNYSLTGGEKITKSRTFKGASGAARSAGMRAMLAVLAAAVSEFLSHSMTALQSAGFLHEVSDPRCKTLGPALTPCNAAASSDACFLSKHSSRGFMLPPRSFTACADHDGFWQTRAQVLTCVQAALRHQSLHPATMTSNLPKPLAFKAGVQAVL